MDIRIFNKPDIVFLSPLCYNRRRTLVFASERGTEMIQVVKRDGEIAEFNLNKITEAIKKAFRATKKEYSRFWSCFPCV